MAHIFKHPENGQKGILVFTHKEARSFSKFKKKTRFKLVNKIQNFIYPKSEFQDYYEKKLNLIKSKYFIGIHFGWFHNNFPIAKKFDFIMAGESTISFDLPKDTYSIPMNSRAFISRNFKNNEYDLKYWDIINVSRNANFKNLDKFLEMVRKLYDEGKMYKVLLIVPPNKSTNKKNYYFNLETDYLKMFSEKEKHLFTLLKLDDKLSSFGLSHSQLIDFYNRSKIFTLFSQKEGESRVIAEALLCGLPVVVKSDLIGGGRDFLTVQNSLLFDSYENSHKTFINAIENYSDFKLDKEYLNSNLSEDFSIETLKTHFDLLYKSKSELFNGELINTDNLANRLPAHDNSVPWYINKTGTSDILMKSQFETLIKSLRIS